MRKLVREQFDDLRGWGVLAFLLLNLAVRLWMFARSGGSLSEVVMPDEHSYLRIAGELIAEGPRWLVSLRSLQAAPGHVLLLRLVGASVPVVKLLSLAASTATLIPLVSISRRALPSRATFWVAVAFTACLVFDAFAVSVLTESINAFFLTSAVALLLRAAAEASPKWALASGLCLGLATLWRATTLFYPLGLALLLLAVWVLPPLRRRVSFEVPKALRTVGFHAIGLALMTGPVVLKNGLVAGQWKLAAGQGATTYLGADPKTLGWEPYFAGYDFDTFEVSTPYSHVELEGDRRLTEAAVRQIRRDPLGTLALRIHWPVRLFIGEPSEVFMPANSAPQAWKVLKRKATVEAVWNVAWRSLALVFGLWFVARNWRRFEGFILMSVPLYFLLIFLTMFAISRFAVPLLPLLSVPMVGGLLEASRWRWVPALMSIALIAAICFWYAIFPAHVDPARYANHTELARWKPSGAKWSPAYGFAERPGDEEHQRFNAIVDGANVVADGQGVGLEHNQVFLLPIRARAAPAGWALHAYWRSERYPAFSEERTTDSFVATGEREVQFHFAAQPGDTLQAIRFDLDLPEGARMHVGGSWVCNFGCAEANVSDAGLEVRGSSGPEAVVSELVAPMDSTVTATVPIELPPPPSRAVNEVIGASLRWQLVGDADFKPPNRRDFEVPLDGEVHWVHLNPSLFPGGAEWGGTLGKVLLVFPAAHGVEVELGPMRLLKDYRMLRP